MKHWDEKKGSSMSIKRIATVLPLIILLSSIFLGCSGGPLTTREKGAGIGALGGAAAGGLIGAAVGHPGAGAAIGGALGLGAGALIGDQFQGQEIQQQRQDEQIRRNQAEIERQRQELQKIKRQTEY
jgi:outer membrane lipoprotein SlyB